MDQNKENQTYYQTHKDKYIGYNRKYYDENKERILSKMCQKVECMFCHRFVIQSAILRHQRTALCERKSKLYNEQQARLTAMEAIK